MQYPLECLPSSANPTDLTSKGQTCEVVVRLGLPTLLLKTSGLGFRPQAIRLYTLGPGVTFTILGSTAKDTPQHGSRQTRIATCCARSFGPEMATREFFKVVLVLFVVLGALYSASILAGFSG